MLAMVPATQIAHPLRKGRRSLQATGRKASFKALTNTLSRVASQLRSYQRLTFQSYSSHMFLVWVYTSCMSPHQAVLGLVLVDNVPKLT